MARVMAYLRVSTFMKQDNEMQLHAIYKYCAANGYELSDDRGDIIKVNCSSRKDEYKRQINKLYYLGEGDTCIFYSISRLGRDMVSNINIVDKLVRQGVKLIFIQENMVFDMLSNNPLNKLLLNIYSYQAEAVREQISLNTKDKLAELKAKGVTLGWPKGRPKPSKLDKYAKDLVYLRYELEMSYPKILKWLGRNRQVNGKPFTCKITTLTNWFKKPINKPIIDEYIQNIAKSREEID